MTTKTTIVTLLDGSTHRIPLPVADELARFQFALRRLSGGSVDWLDGSRDSQALERAIGIARRALNLEQNP